MSERNATVPTYTATQVRKAEAPLLEAQVPLMARAAKGLAEVALQTLGPPGGGERPRVLVLVGSGNNGGDALYGAAHLADSGVKVDVVPVGSRWHEGGMRAALAAGARRVAPFEVEDLLEGIQTESRKGQADFPYDLVVDGIVGTGASGNSSLRGGAAELVETIWEFLDNASYWPHIIAVDVPSGLDPDTGVADGPVLAADITVTFGGVKHGLVSEETLWLVGEIVLIPIGLESELAKLVPAGEADVEVFTQESQ